MPFEVSPHKLVYGGDALAHAEGRTVLVARAAPGDRLEVETMREAKGVIYARPLRVLEPSPDRIEPPCPYFGRCGGCQYQHLEIAAQVRWKSEILRETLRRVGKIACEAPIPVHSAPPWNYRNQAEIKIAPSGGGNVELGFFEAESHRLFPVDACLILSPQLNAVLAHLREPSWAARLRDFNSARIMADDRDEKVHLIFRGRARAPSEPRALAEDLRREIPAVAGVSIETAAGRETFGETALTYRVGEFEYRVSPGAFFQTSRFLIPDLVEAVGGDCSGTLALDLYAGVGLFTLPLARRFERVIGVESGAEAGFDLEANLHAYKLEGARVSRQAVFDVLRRFALGSPDLVVLDPPRAGVGQPSLELLSAIRPSRIHYVSCHPPTLARDLARFIAHGYRLDSVEMFDFFPHTYHVESLCRLSLGG